MPGAEHTGRECLQDQSVKDQSLFPVSASAPGLFCVSRSLGAASFSPPILTLAPASW